ncbi:MAG: methylmalonyl Co-A mutase-associated GTPase MeaB [Saprospiraceae bacterium]|nr:methylmalonyl Co-A mutase-associated GTPase MeaB [Saprospiraceae bacterium]
MGNSDNITPIVNPSYSLFPKEVKPLSYYIKGLERHDRYVLSESITLLESSNHKKRKLAEEIIQNLSTNYPGTIRLGITGAPGVGKSTFIESLGLFLIHKGHRPAILAIDPSSQKSKGSILGDKTRMDQLAAHPNAFIRPTAAGSVLGGTASNTKESILVCEAAGFDFILVETVGVGQSETEVDNITDVNILLLQPGAGDDIQGIKRGIIENADIFIISKADGLLNNFAEKTKTDYKSAVQLLHHPIDGWEYPILLCSAIENRGIEDIYNEILKYCALTKAKGFFYEHRRLQELKWFDKRTGQMIQELILKNKMVRKTYNSLLNLLGKQTINTSTALIQMEKVLSAVLKTEK